MIRKTYQLTAEDDNYLKSEIETGKPICQIAKDFGIKYSTLNLRLGSFIKEYKSKINKIKEDKILESFERHKYVSDIEKELGYWERFISNTLKKYGKQVYDGKDNKHARKRPINDSFFYKIDTEEKAYFLGFMYADGCVNIRKNPKRDNSTIYVARIALQQGDKDILEKFSKLVYNDIILNKYIYKDGRGQDEYILNMHSKKICEDLIKLGCVQRKSSIIKFPTFEQVPENLYHHFLRGYFDGDGSVGNYKNNNYRVSITSSNEFVFGWSNFFKSKVNSSGWINRFKNYATISYAGRLISLKFRDILYNNATIYLTRKKEIFDNIPNEI
jgi:hypothetical protein